MIDYKAVAMGQAVPLGGLHINSILEKCNRVMEILHRYYYRQGLAVAKAVIYAILSVGFVAFGVYSFIHWELSFMFHDWHGYVVLIVYGLMTLAVILSAVESFKKVAKTRRDIPAFAVSADGFVFYGHDGSATTIPFADCEQVRFNSVIRFRVPTLLLIVKYHEKKDPDTTLRFEVSLSELNCSVKEIDKQLKRVYQKYKKASAEQ